MSLSLTTLFTRIGHHLGRINEVNAYRGTTLPAGVTTVEGDYVSTDLNLVDGINSQLTQAQGAETSIASYYRGLARSTVIQMVIEASPQSNKSLSTALNYVVAQMVAGSQTVQASAVAASVAAGSNTGNAVCIATTKTASGLVAENLFAEVIAGVVTNDSQSGGATAGREGLSFAGQFAVSDALSYLYPSGSGASQSLRAIAASSYNGSGTANQLANGDFETWTVANIPDGWHIGTGTAGTQVLQSTGTFYDGLSSLEFAGDASTLTSLYTALGTDTQAAVKPLTQYAVNGWMKVSAAPAAGVLTVALTDGSGTVINDAQGNANSFTVNLVTLGTTFVPVNGWFRTPRVLPSAVRLQFKLTTALSASKNLFIDRVSLASPAPFYSGGPTIAVFSGNANLISGDSFTVTTTSTPGLLQAGFDRLFGMKSLGLLLPSVASSPTISDSLIV